MARETPDPLTEERVTKLQTIAEHRNALLREMYLMLRRRNNVGQVLDLSDAQEDIGLIPFLTRFDLQKNPSSGSIDLFSDSEILTMPLPSPSPSPPSPPARMTKIRNKAKVIQRSNSVGGASTPKQPRKGPIPMSPIVSRQQSPAVLVDQESDDELDLIGSPSPSVRSNRRSHSETHSEIIHIADTPDVPQPIPEDEDDDATEVDEAVAEMQRKSSVDVCSPGVSSPAPKSEVDADGETEDAMDLSDGEDAEEAAVAEEVKDDDDSDMDMQVDSPEPSSPPRAKSISVGPQEESPLTSQEAKPPEEEEEEVEEREEVPQTKEPVSTAPELHETDEELVPPQAAQVIAHQQEAVEPDQQPVVEEPVVATPDVGEPAPSQPEAPILPEPEVSTASAQEAQAQVIERPELELVPIEPITEPEGTVQSSPKPEEVQPSPEAATDTMVVDAESQPEVLESMEEMPAVPPGATLPVETAAEASDEREDVSMDIEVPSSPAAGPEPPADGPVMEAETATQEVEPIVAPMSYFLLDPTLFQAPPLSPPSSPLERRYQFNPQYTLPPLKSLPAEFNRKARPSKLQRKKEKAEKEGKKDKDKDDFVPMGSTKWVVTAKVNPVSKKLARANKCLSTRDWMVGTTELRLIRAMDRIEALKEAGRWSFRQPKKQRNLAGSTKTHWDYLLDEMKWMRTDFREERKWKLALAYNLSAAVVEWHEAGSIEERLAKGICKLWSRPRSQDEAPEEAADPDETMESPTQDEEGADLSTSGPEISRTTSLLLGDYGSDDEEDEESDPVIINDQDIANQVQEALDAQQPGIPIDTTDLKTEDIEDASALQVQEASQDVTMTDSNQVDGEEQPSGLKTDSSDPVLGSSSLEDSKASPQSTGGEPDPSLARVRSFKQLYAPLREMIAQSSSDKLFLEHEDFRLPKPDGDDSNVFLPFADFSVIFPDLQPYGLPAFPGATPAESKKKSEKRNDKDDSTKRVDEVMQAKIFPANRFMHLKPTLLSTLQPARHWKKDHWVMDIDEPPVMADFDAPVGKFSDDCTNDMFDQRPLISSVAQIHIRDFKEREPRKHLHFWSEEDDALLKTLIDRYGGNWKLISECFNGSRITVPTDARTPRDCAERWREKWAPDPRHRTDSLVPGIDATPPPPATPNQMTTRGVKRMASASISSQTSPVLMLNEPKKRRRHAFVQESIRKATKRRTEAAAKLHGRRSTTVHETHGQYSKLPKHTPAELSKIKSEKEFKESQQATENLRRRQVQLVQDETNRRLAQPANGAAPGAAPPAQTQNAAAANVPAAPTANGAAPVPAVGAAPGPVAPSQPVQAAAAARSAVPVLGMQTVPQIRPQVNISQQQRANTPMIGGTRLSPQQVLQARAQAQQFTQALVQAQALQNAAVANTVAGSSSNTQQQGTNGAPIVGANAHLSPPNHYVSRDASASPAHSQTSPPRNIGTPSNAVSPRPPSAQPMPTQMTPAQQAQFQAQQVQQIQLALQTGQLPHHYYVNPAGGPKLPVAPYATEALQQAIRASLLQRQHAQQQQQQQQGQHQQPPHPPQQ